MATRRTQPPGADNSDVPIWRPSGQSYQNLAAFAAAIAVAAAVVLAITDSVGLVVTTLIVAVLAGLLLTSTISRQRVRSALAIAKSQDFGNWPGTEEERRELRQRGWHRCRRSVAMAVVLGAFAGFYPSVGVACVGAGTAGLVGALAVVSWIRHYENEHDVTVMSPAKSGRGRSTLLFVTAAGRF
jgi:hypothetical protein